MTGITLSGMGTIASLVYRAAAGEEEACAQLVAEHHADMIRAAYVVTGDGEWARDAAQAAWTKAWQRLGSLQDPERVRPWLVAIAANEARQLLRGQRRRLVREIFQRPPDQTADPTAAIDLLDLRRAVSRLSPDDRVLLALRFAAGLDSTEIGRQLRLSPSGVRTRLARVLDGLRKELDHG
jgi:RNA polymerase sigma-70 factor (ECF subfamily)